MKQTLFKTILLFIFCYTLNISIARSQTKIDTLPYYDTIQLAAVGNFVQMNAEQLRLMPFRNFSTFGMVAPSAYRLKGDRMYYFDNRATNDQYYLDGMQIKNVDNFPIGMLESYSLYWGTTPISKGFSSAAITSFETLDNFNKLTVIADVNTDLSYNMQSFNGEIVIGIPLSKNKNKNRIPSLLIAGKYAITNNTDPIWPKTQELNEEVLDFLLSNPLRRSFEHYEGTFWNAEFVDEGDFHEQQVPANHGAQGIYPYVKLNIPVFKNADLTLGNYSVFDERKLYDFDNAIFNSSNNPVQQSRNFDSYLNWEQNFLISEDLTINYNALIQYSNYYQKTESEQHGNNFFDYGHLGIFDTYKKPSYELGSVEIDGVPYSGVWLLNSWGFDTLVTFTPSNINPALAAYTSNYYDIYEGQPQGHYQNFDQIRLGGGLLNGMNSQSVYGLWNNTGYVNSNYNETNYNRIRIAAQATVEYKNHHIQLGGEYNRETYSSYSINPVGLWNLMRGLTNFHIEELDRNNPIPIYSDGVVDSVIYYRKYDAESQESFDINLREALGLPVDGLDYIMIDSYDRENNTIKFYNQDGELVTINTPADLLNLNLFSNLELLNSGDSFVNYSGYNYTGEKQKNSSDPYSFYNDYSIGAYEPSFWTAFIDDNFSWKNFNINLGVRIDAYNANQPVLNDLYCLFPINNVQETQEINYVDFEKPDNIGNDYLVYVNRNYDPTSVTGFRNGDQWYDAMGNEISDPSILDVGNGISPYLKDPYIYNLGDANWTPDMTFHDYSQSISFLPQIKIDFNFSKRINAYFQYNSFTQNPTYGNRYSPVSYYFWNSIASSQLISNPALTPVKTGKMFVGVKALINKYLMGEVAYLYIVTDNYITPFVVAGAYPFDYITLINSKSSISNNGFMMNFQFVNQDTYGPSGGLSFTKMYPKEGDINYLTTSDMIVNLYAGYKFNFLSNSNAPIWMNKKIIKGLGGSVYYQFRRGTPYIYTKNGFPLGYKLSPNINIFNIHLEKDLIIGHNSLLNVYLTIENLFSFNNVFNVYSETGLADNDGYLSDPANQGAIDRQLDPDTYRLLYQMHLYDPANFDIPRIWRIGVVFKY